MKSHGMIFSGLLLLSTVFTIPSEPFSYKYEITANGNSAQDLWELYDVKEKVIETYDRNYLNHPEKEQMLFRSVSDFAVTNHCRSYYVSGVLVVLIGNAKGVCLEGNFRKDSCDDSVIHEKVYLFDLFR